MNLPDNQHPNRPHITPSAHQPFQHDSHNLYYNSIHPTGGGNVGNNSNQPSYSASGGQMGMQSQAQQHNRSGQPPSNYYGQGYGQNYPVSFL